MSIQSHLSMLIGLAKADDDFADDEKQLIYMVGKANGLTNEEIDTLVESPIPMAPISSMSDDEKFEHLYNVVQLMKIDSQVYLSEIKYCEEVAEKLGFKKKVIGALSSRIYSDPSITADKDSLKKAVMKYQE
ncbi:MAG: TerB family tellurite resistance protein [bacterium]|nr:TerB family tellurite resistance protein [bacterium]